MLLLAWCVAGTVTLLRARAAAADAIDELERFRDTVEPRDVLDGADTTDLRRARFRFADAQGDLGSLLVAPLRVLPVVGRQVRAVERMVDAAHTVTDVGIDALEAVGDELERTPASGAERTEAATRLGAIAADADARLSAVDIGSGDALVGPVADAWDRLDEELGELQATTAKAAVAAAGIAEFLQGPTRYLVLAANAGEMRAGSGMFLQAGVLTVQGGEFDLSPMVSTTELRLPPGAVPITGDLADRWGFVGPNQEWRNLAMSPRFDANAELAARMWAASSGEQVDGVLALDAEALRGLLAATGPVDVDGDRIGADEVIWELLVGQYEGIDAEDFGEHARRRERLSAIASAAVEGLDAGGWDMGVLVDELRRAADGRHVLAWSAKPAQQDAWRAAGITGELPPDAVLLSLVNQGGTKLDPFLAVTATLDARPAGDVLVVTVEVRVRNEAPRGLPPYVQGPSYVAQEGTTRGVDEGVYAGIVTLNVPAAARQIRLGDGELLVAGPDGDTFVVGTRLQLARDESATVTATFELPAGTDRVEVMASGRLPPVEWRAFGATWEDGRSRGVTLPG